MVTWLLVTWLYVTWLYVTWLYVTWLCATRLCATWLCATRLCATRLCATWLCATRLCATWLRATRLRATWLCATWLGATWLCATWLYVTWLCATWRATAWRAREGFQKAGDAGDVDDAVAARDRKKNLRAATWRARVFPQLGALLPGARGRVSKKLVMLVMLTMLWQLETAKKENLCAATWRARVFPKAGGAGDAGHAAEQAMLRSRLTSYLALIRLRLQGHHQLAGPLTFQGQVHGGNMEGQQSRATPPLQRALRSAPEAPLCKFEPDKSRF